MQQQRRQQDAPEVEKQTVIGKHWQAAACVALTLASGVSQGWAQAPAQNTGTPAATGAQTNPAQQPNGAPTTGAPPTGAQPGGAQQNGAQTTGNQQTGGQTGSQINPNAPAAPQAVQNDTTRQPGLPQAPDPKLTEPLYLRDTPHDYAHAKPFLPNPLRDYTTTDYPAPRLSNTPRLDDLLRNGKIFLSLNDAVTLALENNFDIAIARINLDIADTDLLRAKAGSTLRGVSTGLVTNTLGGTTTTITGGGGPGGTSTSSGGGGTGASGLVLSTNGGGPTPETLDPYITGQAQYERETTPKGSSAFNTTSSSGTSGGGSTGTGTGTGTGTTSTLGTSSTSYTSATGTYDISYNQGFLTGTDVQVIFNNTHVSTNSPYSAYSPDLSTVFRVEATQHLLQGFGTWINGRFIIQAKNNRRITDSAFRQQIIYTVTQVESIYWALVSAYEDDQSKERALQQSTQLASDNRKQLQIGTLAPLDVVNSDAAVATDKQSLITSQSNLEYQQLLMKQAIARNLNDPQLANAPVVPTDRVGLDRLPEEDTAIEDLVRQAYVNNPQVEQASLQMKNNLITIRAEKNGLLPIVDAYGFYGGQGVGGTQNPIYTTQEMVPPGTFPTRNYAGTLGNTFNNSAPDYGVGVNVQIPLRNRVAQADQVRSQMEYRQEEIRLQQLYTQLRIQVINAQYAITNDRSAVASAQSSRDYAAQSLDAEQKKYRLGASTTANVLSQQRNLATAENNLISATAAYARDRSSLRQILSSTLDLYGISLQDAANGTVTQQPNVPGLTPPTAPAAPKPLSSNPPPLPQ